MKVIIFGALGQLGRELARRLPADARVDLLDKEELDIGDELALRRTVLARRPDLLINAAAYTAVDEAEANREAAFEVNATGARNVALAARDAASRLIHISTDFIFDGRQGQPYREDAEAHPLSAYGRSKLDGEDAVREVAGDDAVIVRTSWLYSTFGGNFVKTMLSLMRQRPRIGVVSDQVGCPTWTGTLADAVWEIGGREDIAGIVHWTDAGVASWYDLAVAVQELSLEIGLLSKAILVEPIPTDAFPTPAKRPAYSVLDTSESRRMLATAQLHWRTALRHMLEELGGKDDA